MDFLENAKDLMSLWDAQTTMLALLFMAVLFLVSGVAGLIFFRDPILRRFISGAKKTGTAGGGLALSASASNDSEMLKRFDKYLAPQDDRERSTIRHRLAKAGYRSRAAVRNFYIIRTVLGLVVPAAVAIAYPLYSRTVDTQEFLLTLIVLVLCGLYLPPLFVLRQIQYRQVAMQDGFPDALDMLLVCVEAGLGLDAALARVADEVGIAHPIVADELVLCGLELRAGKSRGDVLSDFARRVDVDDVRAFTAVLNQSDRYGTNVANAIRVHAAEMRNKRLLRAEEKANKLPVKMALAAIVFTLPPVFLVLISPAAISVMKMLDRLTE